MGTPTSEAMEISNSITVLLALNKIVEEGIYNLPVFYITDRKKKKDTLSLYLNICNNKGA